MARFGQGLIQGLINPGYELNTTGMMAGGLAGRIAERKKEELQRQQQQAALMSAYKMGQSPGGSDPASAMAALTQAVPGIEAKDLMAAQTAGTKQAERAAKAKAQQDKLNAQQGFKTTLVSALEEKGQASFANLVSKVPDFDALPAEVQNRVLTAAGITDPKEQEVAKSSIGKLAMDMGYQPNTPEFKQKVNELANAQEAGTTVETFNSINSVVKQNVDLGKSVKINDAVTAVGSSGLQGAEALQENTIVDIFGSSLRAEASVRRFVQSASLPERLINGVSMWATGEKPLAREDREAILYAAIRMQEESIGNTINNSGKALNIPDSTLDSIKQVYSFPETTQEFKKRFEEKYRKEANKTPQVTTQEEYDALPSGAIFIEDGKQYRKP